MTKKNKFLVSILFLLFGCATVEEVTKPAHTIEPHCVCDTFYLIVPEHTVIRDTVYLFIE